MKPFNLEKALAGEPVVTRAGEKVKIAGYNPDAKKDSAVIGWVGAKARTWGADGRFYDEGDQSSSNDLFMGLSEHKEWIVRAFLKNKHAAVYGPYTDEKTAGETAKKVGGSIHEITVTE